MVPPGGEMVLPHPGGGLTIVIEGEMLPDFPVTKHLEAIAKANGQISVHLNSPGGDLLAGMQIGAALLQAGPDRVDCLVAGLCGSAATFPLVAASRRRVLDGSRLWCHAPSNMVWGNAGELRQCADQLEALLPRMRKAYERVCPPELVTKWLSGPDYVFDARQALACGLATEVVSPEAIPTPR
jgi:ATP-dependent protease ClpP protease subunit